MKKHYIGSLARHFYEELVRFADRSIRDNLAHDEELLV